MKRLFLLSVFLLLNINSSCSKEEEFSNDLISSSDLLNKINNDPVALDYIEVRAQMEQIIEETVNRNNLTPDQFRNFYTEQNYNELNKIFFKTELIEISLKLQKAANLFNEKYSNLEYLLSDNSKSLDSFQEKIKPFSFLDNIQEKNGCQKYSQNWWIEKSCQATCVVGGVICSSYGVTAVACALGGFVCTNACTNIYC
ncbi:hypothetical protein [Aquimarina sp. Aq107]|nr:hypothetical protein [Aquimarina sp. Aq107]